VETAPKENTMYQHYRNLFFERKLVLLSYVSQQNYGLIENNR
jgi:hypothetical protein